LKSFASYGLMPTETAHDEASKLSKALSQYPDASPKKNKRKASVVPSEHKEESFPTTSELLTLPITIADRVKRRRTKR